MGRNDLINTTRAILAKAGFDVSSALTINVLATYKRKPLLKRQLALH